MHLPKIDFRVPSNVWLIIGIVAIGFVFVFIISHLRHRQINELPWSGFVAGVIAGFIIALALEAVLLIGGQTVLLTILKWQNAPKPIQSFLDGGHKLLFDMITNK